MSKDKVNLSPKAASQKKNIEEVANKKQIYKKLNETHNKDATDIVKQINNLEGELSAIETLGGSLFQTYASPGNIDQLVLAIHNNKEALLEVVTDPVERDKIKYNCARTEAVLNGFYLKSGDGIKYHGLQESDITVLRAITKQAVLDTAGRGYGPRHSDEIIEEAKVKIEKNFSPNDVVNATRVIEQGIVGKDDKDITRQEREILAAAADKMVRPFIESLEKDTKVLMDLAQKPEIQKQIEKERTEIAIKKLVKEVIATTKEQQGTKLTPEEIANVEKIFVTKYSSLGAKNIETQNSQLSNQINREIDSVLSENLAASIVKEALAEIGKNQKVKPKQVQEINDKLLSNLKGLGHEYLRDHKRDISIGLLNSLGKEKSPRSKIIGGYTIASKKLEQIAADIDTGHKERASGYSSIIRNSISPKSTLETKQSMLSSPMSQNSLVPPSPVSFPNHLDTPPSSPPSLRPRSSSDHSFPSSPISISRSNSISKEQPQSPSPIVAASERQKSDSPKTIPNSLLERQRTRGENQKPPSLIIPTNDSPTIETISEESKVNSPKMEDKFSKWATRKSKEAGKRREDIKEQRIESNEQPQSPSPIVAASEKQKSDSPKNIPKSLLERKRNREEHQKPPSLIIPTNDGPTIKTISEEPKVDNPKMEDKFSKWATRKPKEAGNRREAIKKQRIESEKDKLSR